MIKSYLIWAGGWVGDEKWRRTRMYSTTPDLRNRIRHDDRKQ